jgi:hypothetical protein
MPTRAERLADHFIRSAGIAAVHVDADGTIAGADSAGMFGPADRVVLCCAAGNQYRIAMHAAARVPAKAGHAAALAAVREAAAEMGIGLTPIELVIQRAFAAVGVVNQTLAEMQRTGQMRDLNREFAELRKADKKLRYQDYLHGRKAAMLEAVAREK